MSIVEAAAWKPPALTLPYEQELLEDARHACRRRMTRESLRARELNLLGLLASRESSHSFAVRCLSMAARLEPQNVDYVLDLAVAQMRGGELTEALGTGLHSVTLDPARVETLRPVARILSYLQRLMEAAALYQEYLRQRPDDAEVIGELADIRRDMGRPMEAIDLYVGAARAAQSPRAQADFIGRIARVYLATHAWSRAIEVFQEALALDDGRSDLYLGVGRALMGLGRIEEAITAFRDALTIEPVNADACSQLVCALELVGRPGDATRAWLQLGVALEATGQLAEAATAFRQALARKSDCLDALMHLGHAELMLGRPAQAIAPTRAAVAIAPAHISAHVQLGWALQLTGDWDGGWEEFRWLSDGHRINHWRLFEQPRWDGSSLEGKRVLFFAGQDYGLGDTLHLVRFARHLKRRGAFVIVECQPPLAPIISRMPDVDVTVPRGAPLRAFDVMAPMMWVPSVDRSARRLADADVPYLSADEALAVRWSERIGRTATRRVGLCWGGKSDRRDAQWRFTSLATFAPLAGLPNVTLFSLQMGPQADELFCPPAGVNVLRLLDDSHSVDDTAAIVANLDLVIAVDTMIVHLAGAMGRPVWTVLPFAGDWRWLRGETTPWYPSMRLFRQTTPGDWTGVIAQVRLALESWASASSPEPMPRRIWAG